MTDAGGDITIRPLRASDAARLAAIYRDSIRHAGAQHYSPEQVAAWSALGDDLPAFRAWLQRAATRVAEDRDGRSIGFAGIEPPQRIASLFVAPECMRRGVASALVRHLLEVLRRQGVSSATTEASAFSRPVFERCGFRVTARERTLVRGVEFSREVMRLDRLSG